MTVKSISLRSCRLHHLPVWLCALSGMLALCTTFLHADRVILTNDRVWEGRIVAENDTGLVIDTVGGPVQVSRRDIKQIERRKTAGQIYEERARALTRDDLAGHYLLGLWCENRGLPSQARYHLHYVLGLDPDHDGAHKALGHTRYQGKWMTQDEARQALGLKNYKGRWMTPEAAAREEATDARKALSKSLAREVRKIARAIVTARDFRERLEAEKRLYKMHDPLAFGAIADLLDSESAQVRIASLKTIRKLGIHDVRGRLVRTALFDPVAQARERAGELLTRRYDNRVRRILVKALQSEQKQVRTCAAKILGVVKDPTTINALIEGLYVTYHRRSGDGAPVLGLVVGARGHDAQGVPRIVPLDQPMHSLDIFVINYDALEALRNMTGQDFGTSKRAWLEWWTENEDEFTIWSREAKQEVPR